jgi:thiamine kinase-like enzyme
MQLANITDNCLHWQTSKIMEWPLEGLMQSIEDEIRHLPIWASPPSIEPLNGGMTNRNYLVTDSKGKYVARLGSDNPVHHISRSNELAASRAAHAAGISPAVIFHQPGLLVLAYIEARALTAADIRAKPMLEKILPILRTCHREIPKYFRGPAAIFWVFHVVRDYAADLRQNNSLYVDRLPELIKRAERLEAASSPHEIVFGHNDLLAANFLDDGKKLWLIDWDYAGFNTPLFDLGGLASNSEFSEPTEKRLLEMYHEAPFTDQLWQRYSAMKCASLLREAMWSMVSEIHSGIDFNYAAYTAENLARFERAWQDFLLI